jgi:hypothetical protein
MSRAPCKVIAQKWHHCGVAFGRIKPNWAKPEMCEIESRERKREREERTDTRLRERERKEVKRKKNRTDLAHLTYIVDHLIKSSINYDRSNIPSKHAFN